MLTMVTIISQSSIMIGMDFVCKPSDPEVFTGRIPLENDRYFDINCNGIKGIDEYGVALEQKF